jgi:heme-degrading monooxygenase HmoA
MLIASAISFMGDQFKTRDRMYVIVWEFTVRPDSEEAFTKLYGPVGEWVALFRDAPGYLGTELLRADDGSARYLTVDRWRSAADSAKFRRTVAVAYAALDAEGEALTEAERYIGEFVTVDL